VFRDCCYRTHAQSYGRSLKPTSNTPASAACGRKLRTLSGSAFVEICSTGLLQALCLLARPARHSSKDDHGTVSVSIPIITRRRQDDVTDRKSRLEIGSSVPHTLRRNSSRFAKSEMGSQLFIWPTTHLDTEYTGLRMGYKVETYGKMFLRTPFVQSRCTS
jgi:hypothetical protein